MAVHVLPFEADAHAATVEGALGILHFVGTAGLSLVTWAASPGAICPEDRGDLVDQGTALDRPRSIACAFAQSALLLRGLVGL